MQSDPAGGCLFLTIILVPWAILLFFVARFLVNLAANYIGLEAFEVALLSAVIAIVGAIAAASTILADEK